jgi:hypothetical protein
LTDIFTLSKSIKDNFVIAELSDKPILVEHGDNSIQGNIHGHGQLNKPYNLVIDSENTHATKIYRPLIPTMLNINNSTTRCGVKGGICVTTKVFGLDMCLGFDSDNQISAEINRDEISGTLIYDTDNDNIVAATRYGFTNVIPSGIEYKFNSIGNTSTVSGAVCFDSLTLGTVYDITNNDVFVSGKYRYTLPNISNLTS